MFCVVTRTYNILHSRYNLIQFKHHYPITQYSYTTQQKLHTHHRYNNISFQAYSIHSHRLFSSKSTSTKTAMSLGIKIGFLGAGAMGM